MPKVIHVVRKFVPSEWGGTETHLVNLVRELSRFGWTSEVHAPGEAGTDGSPLEQAGASFHTYRALYPYWRLDPRQRATLVASGGNLFSFDEVWRLASDRRASIVHAHAIGRLGGIVRFGARFRKTPYAVTLHGPVRANSEVVRQDVARRAATMTDLGAPLGWFVGARRVVRDANLVFVLNPAEHAAWKQERQGRHLELTRHGVDPTPATAEARRAARARIPGVGEGRFVAVIGRLDATKGQDIAMDAYLRGCAPDHHLVLVGSVADPDYAEALNRAIDVERQRIHVVGGVSPAVARGFLAECSLALMPSRAESFGLALLEAWAEGAPALHSAAEGFAAIARNTGSTATLVDSASPEAWAERIRQTLGDSALLERERREGPRRVQLRYSWRAVAGEVARAYRSATLEGDTP